MQGRAKLQYIQPGWAIGDELCQLGFVILAMQRVLSHSRATVTSSASATRSCHGRPVRVNTLFSHSSSS